MASSRAMCPNWEDMMLALSCVASPGWRKVEDRGGLRDRWKGGEGAKHRVIVNAVGSKENGKTPNFTPNTFFFVTEAVILDQRL